MLVSELIFYFRRLRNADYLPVSTAEHTGGVTEMLQGAYVCARRVCTLSIITSGT
jgi:hypothetical protein